MGVGRFTILFGLLSASAAVAIDMGDADLKVGGYVDNGRFQLKRSDGDGEIISRTAAKWSIDKRIDDHWTAMAKLHWLFWRNQATDLALFHIAGVKFDSDLQGAIDYASGASSVRAGLYDFKYNQDSKNLGEYLLRSEAYPTLLESSQGQDLLADSHARVMGVQYNLDHALVRQTALVYAEQVNVPVNDVSLVYLANVGPHQSEMGFGAAYHRAFQFGKSINNSVLSKELRDYVSKEDLTAKAFKFSLRGRLDLAEMLGTRDNFKLYAEVALLGLKNDSLYYRKMAQRMPMMLGMEIPTFGILNMFSLEGEYFQNPYYEREYLIADAGGNNFSPLPYIDNYNAADLPKDKKDDFRWSLLMRKALNRWIDIDVRLASDHLRLISWTGDYEGGEPFTRSSKDWYCLARIEFHN